MLRAEGGRIVLQYKPEKEDRSRKRTMTLIKRVNIDYGEPEYGGSLGSGHLNWKKEIYPPDCF